MFCFYKDFHQIFSIIPREIRDQIVSIYLKYSSFWQYIQYLFFIINIYLFSPHMSLEKRLCQEEFVNRILIIGEDRDIINKIIQ